jgi:CheY-like chemotaxis protein
MTPEVQAKIFEPFFTTKERGRGTGLGLAAVHGTVTQLGGFIEVASTPGVGTSFTIYLPKTERPRLSSPDSGRAAAPVGQETILLVEDEPGVRAFTKIALQRFGYRVIDAESAEAALALLADTEAPIHLMVCDIVLPGMDGTELATRVVHDRPEVRLLFMSGYGDRLGTVEGFLQPKVQLLEKPFSAHALLTKTREVLEAPCESVTT